MFNFYTFFLIRSSKTQNFRSPIHSNLGSVFAANEYVSKSKTNLESQDTNAINGKVYNIILIKFMFKIGKLQMLRIFQNWTMWLVSKVENFSVTIILRIAERTTRKFFKALQSRLKG